MKAPKKKKQDATGRIATAENKAYREQMLCGGLVPFRVLVKETDLLVQAEKELSDLARESVFRYRGHIEGYISAHPEFVSTLKPWNESGPAPAIVRDMIAAGKAAGVGPMASVAGAVAQHVGLDLLRHSSQVVVENGGDVFFRTEGLFTAAVFAGKSELSMRIGIRLKSGKKGMAVCTSSGTVGHSLSMGRADAVCVVARSCALADAAATAIGNTVSTAEDVENAVQIGRNIPGVKGVMVIFGPSIGVWGGLEIVPLKEKRVVFSE